jgi:anti-anti-sigma regulatory factor
MLKISTLETSSERRLILEGKLIAPWTSAVSEACAKAKVNLQGRELIVDLRGLSVISQSGENLLITLMNDAVKFHCSLFAKQLLDKVSVRAQNQRRTEVIKIEEPHAT